MLRNSFKAKNEIILLYFIEESIVIMIFRKIKIVLWKNILENYNLYFSKLY